MQSIKGIAIGLGSLLGLFGILTLVGHLLPKSYRVERTATIQAPLPQVFNHLADLSKWENWMPWDDDTRTTVHYSEVSTGKGAWCHWTTPDMGNGMLSVTEVEPHTKLGYIMEFEDTNSATKGWFSLEESAQGTTVTWVDEGELDNSPLHGYMTLFMDGIIGKEFERGLANLKALCE